MMVTVTKWLIIKHINCVYGLQLKPVSHNRGEYTGDGQLCLDRISVRCNTNHMLISPVKTKSMVITTLQKKQLSGLSLRLSLDGQNIENVPEHRLLGLIVNNKFRWQAQIEHICKTNRLQPRYSKRVQKGMSLSLTSHSSGAVWESRWTSWAVRPNEPSGFRGRKDLFNHASALVSVCP